MDFQEDNGGDKWEGQEANSAGLRTELCSSATVTGPVTRGPHGRGKDGRNGTWPLLGLDGNLALTQPSNRAGQKSRSGEKGSSAYNGCKAAKLGHLASSTASSQERGLGLDARAGGTCCPLPPSGPWGLTLGVAESAEGRAPGPGQVPKRKVEREAGGLGSVGVARAPRWGRAWGRAERCPVMWPRRWPHCAPWPSCAGPRCSRSCGPARH